MPLLHKPPAVQAEAPAKEMETGEAIDVLAQLMALASQRVNATPSTSGRASGRRGTSSYDRFVTRAATLIGLVVCAAAWFVGAYFTLAWLASLGLTWAADAIAPLSGVVQGAGEAASSTGNGIALLVWALPVGFTLAEIGFDPGRARGLASRTLWGSFLLVDATTTALGLYPPLARSVGSWPLAAGLAAAIGLALALVPEKLARRLIRENL